jgi:hypothetical protein
MAACPSLDDLVDKGTMKHLARFGILAVVLVMLGFMACGGHTSYDYSFLETGCETGAHTFDTLADMCAGLQSDSLNNSCAIAARQNFFQMHCTGTFQEAP